jgi:hypothetical protein
LEVDRILRKTVAAVVAVVEVDGLRIFRTMVVVVG